MTTPKHIINDPEDAVAEMIEGLLLQYPNHLSKLQNHHVLLKARKSSTQVQLLSGGGSGHEPSHAGWIGDGMLAGAICGGIFASPSVSSILAAIRAVTAINKEAGVLLIVKNYTGDRLNFGLACEKANMEGIPCKMVVVADDCAIDRQKGITGARGIAGTVLVHKIAGAAAALGKSLEEVVEIAERVKSRIGTLGVALDTVTLPGAVTVNDRLKITDNIEIGLGIHGEAGLRQSPLMSANQMAKDTIARIHLYGKVKVQETTGKEMIVPLFEKGDELCLLVNNLGGTSNFEMSIFAKACIEVLEQEPYKCCITRVLVGTYMTSFNMHGVSVSIFNLTGDQQLANLLDDATDAPAWTGCEVLQKGEPRPSAVNIQEPPGPKSSIQMNQPAIAFDNFYLIAEKMVKAACQALIDKESILTEYDTVVGDGDCGTTMKRGATKILERIKEGTLPIMHPVPMFAELANIISNSMGGTSGVLIELFFRNISSSLSNQNSIGFNEMCKAIQKGTEAISLYGGAGPGSRTMLDALIPAADMLVSSQGNIQTSARMAKKGTDFTATLKSASAGRSNYVSGEILIGTPDPGAFAVWTVFEALATFE